MALLAETTQVNMVLGSSGEWRMSDRVISICPSEGDPAVHAGCSALLLAPEA